MVDLSHEIFKICSENFLQESVAVVTASVTVSYSTMLRIRTYTRGGQTGDFYSTNLGSLPKTKMDLSQGVSLKFKFMSQRFKDANTTVCSGQFHDAQALTIFSCITFGIIEPSYLLNSLLRNPESREHGISQD